MKKILIIDDEQRMLDLVSLYLLPKGFQCIKYTSALSAIQYLDTHQVDLILLDIMMPELNGWEACKMIRRKWDYPIIMLTARTEKPDVVKGLHIGADDYITKPFDGEELVARIEAMLRRNRNSFETITFKGLELNQESHELHFQGKSISLTPKELSLLAMFLTNPNRVYTRDHLISAIWGIGVATEDRTIDSHVRNLRDKLRKAGFPADDYLITVWGVGYKWNGAV
jgi:DNA-binding response OmpR family regulator